MDKLNELNDKLHVQDGTNICINMQAKVDELDK